MIKINLLPKSINEKRITRMIALGFGALFIAIVVGGLVYHSILCRQVADMVALAEFHEAWQKKVQGIQQQAADVRASTTPIKQKIDFINAVLEYNNKVPDLFREVAKWTYHRIWYLSMQTDGTQVTMQARAKSLDDIGRFLLNMYQATHLFSEVSISGVPGYNQQGSVQGSQSSGGQIAGSQATLAGIQAIESGVTRKPDVGNWIEFNVVCKLKTPFTPPVFAASAAPGAPGAPGAPVPTVPTPTVPTPTVPTPTVPTPTVPTPTAPPGS